MAFTKLTKDMAIIQKLDDEPNDTGGLTAAQLKAKFDEPGETVKAWINETFIPEAEQALNGALLGQMPDGSVTADKLAFGVVNPNLLDNWYFGDPVNQRGKAEYAGASGYTIDRWKMTNANTEVSLFKNEEEKFKFWLTAFEGYTPYLQQLLEDGETLLGKTVTLSVLSYDELHTATSTLPTAFPSSNTLYCNVADVCDMLVTPTTLSVRLKGPKSEGRAFTAVKLELGSVQTLAHRQDGKWALNELPNRAVELAKCQRYYQLFSAADKIPSHWADFRPTMRATPNTGTVSVNGDTLYCADANL